MNREDNLKPFSKDKQPSDEARKKGWEKRKLRVRLKGPIAKYLNMDVEEFKGIQADIKQNPKNYTMLDVMAINAVAKMMKEFKYYQDQRDRVEGRSTFKQEITADITENLNVEGNIDINHNLEISDEKAAAVLQILIECGAIESEYERYYEKKTQQLLDIAKKLGVEKDFEKDFIIIKKPDTYLTIEKS